MDEKTRCHAFGRSARCAPSGIASSSRWNESSSWIAPRSEPRCGRRPSPTLGSTEARLEGASAVFFGSRIDNGYGFFIPICGLAAYGLAAVLFRLIVNRAPGLLSGVLVGVVVGVGSHPLAWYLGMMYNAVLFRSEGRARDAIGPVIGVAGAFTYSLMSWLYAGWLTVPVGGIVGGLTGWWLGRRALARAARAEGEGVVAGRAGRASRS